MNKKVTAKVQEAAPDYRVKMVRSLGTIREEKSVCR